MYFLKSYFLNSIDIKSMCDVQKKKKKWTIYSNKVFIFQELHYQNISETWVTMYQ